MKIQQIANFSFCILASLTVATQISEASYAQSQEYWVEYNACNNGTNSEFCHCMSNQVVNRGADAIYTIQYCLENVNNVKVTQQEIIDKLESSGTLQKNTAGCLAVARQNLPEYASILNDYCDCLTTKMFYGRENRNVAGRSCSAQYGIPW